MGKSGNDIGQKQPDDTNVNFGSTGKRRRIMVVIESSLKSPKHGNILIKNRTERNILHRH